MTFREIIFHNMNMNNLNEYKVSYNNQLSLARQTEEIVLYKNSSTTTTQLPHITFYGGEEICEE